MRIVFLKCALRIKRVVDDDFVLNITFSFQVSNHNVSHQKNFISHPLCIILLSYLGRKASEVCRLTFLISQCLNKKKKS